MSQEVPSRTKLLSKWIDQTADKQRSFYESKEFLDLTLIAGEDSSKIEAHKIVVLALSDYLLAAFRSSNASEIEIPEIDGITMKVIVDFMYTGSIDISLDSARTTLKAANLLQMKILIDACCDFLLEQLDVTNCLGIALFAEQHNFANLFEKASSFAYKNFEKVSTEKEFLQLKEKEMIGLLSKDVFFPTSVENVCQSLVPWIEYDRINREKSIDQLLSSISFRFLKGKFETEKGHSISDSIEFYKSFFIWLRSRFADKSSTNFLVLVSGKTETDLNMQIYNRCLNSWSHEEVSPIPKKKAEYSRIVVNNKLIIVGGTSLGEDTNSVECLDLATKEWSNLPPMKHKKYKAGLAELNGDLYVIGGRCAGQIIRTVEKYSFVTGLWQDVSPLNVNLYNNDIKTAILDGKLYAADQSSRPMQCYDPVKDQWLEKTAKNEQHGWFGLAAVGAYIYTVAGYTAQRIRLNTVERYDPATDSWTYVAPLKVPITNVKCASLNGRLIICGGDAHGTITNAVQEYNPETNEWKMLAPLFNEKWNYWSYSLLTI